MTGQENGDTTWPYGDIVNLPHHVSKIHPQMPMAKRAAQFAPFAALTGYDEAISETGRLTDAFIELDDDMQEKLNRVLLEAVAEQSTVTVTYFEPDKKKEGGRYLTVKGTIRKLSAGMIVMSGGQSVRLCQVYGIEES